jgi:hypothetical protein
VKALKTLLERPLIMTRARVQVSGTVQRGADLFGAVKLTATLRVPGPTRSSVLETDGLRFSRAGEL